MLLHTVYLEVNCKSTIHCVFPSVHPDRGPDASTPIPNQQPKNNTPLALHYIVVRSNLVKVFTLIIHGAMPNLILVVVPQQSIHSIHSMHSMHSIHMGKKTTFSLLLRELPRQHSSPPSPFLSSQARWDTTPDEWETFREYRFVPDSHLSHENRGTVSLSYVSNKKRPHTPVHS